MDEIKLKIKIASESSYKIRKQLRKEYYDNFVYKVKLEPCTSCNGSGKQKKLNYGK